MSEPSASKPPPPPPVFSGRTRSSTTRHSLLGTTAAESLNTTTNNALQSSPAIDESQSISVPPTFVAASTMTDPLISTHNTIATSTQTDDHSSIQPQIRAVEGNERVHPILNIRSLQGNMHRIIISKDMDIEELACCISQVAFESFQQSFPSCELAENVPDKYIYANHDYNAPGVGRNDGRIAGLFRERDRVFIPLQLVLQNLQLVQNESFRISSKMSSSFVETSQKKDQPQEIYYGSFVREKLIYVTIVVYVAWKVATGGVDLGMMLESLTIKLINVPFALMEIMVDYPLRELYRYGPPVFGWEGLSLPLICSQVTHMGDEQFWRRNLSECEKIYHTKEMASLHFRRPIVLFVLFYVIFLMIRSLVRTASIRRQNRPSQDMVETYKAFQMVLRVLSRGMKRIEDDQNMMNRRRSHS